jgi:hypothetical protein
MWWHNVIKCSQSEAKKMQIERRTHRSDDPLEALSLQLAATAERSACAALILAETGGLTVTEFGADPASEEIAALAPTLSRGGRRWHGAIRTSQGDRLVTVAPVEGRGRELLLCAVGGLICVLGPELASGGRGVARILS